MKIKQTKKLENVRLQMSKKCEFCGHRISFYAFEKDKKICSYCGRYNYRNDYIKFLDLMEKTKNELRQNDEN